ncbi:MAG TPA: protease pro-enzyme activation domain-containing protein [Terracidiphilus sp.]|nr:protease pro-enzyme activation domain-containing protein [Terracidiphilus sp.]
MNLPATRFAFALAVLALAAATAPAQVAGSAVTLNGQTPLRVLNGAVPRVSHYNPEQKLRLVLAIQPPDMAGEEQFIKELTNKNSPNFHKFLSAEEWNARFAPSAEDEQKVVDWATSQGLTVTNRFANRLLVDVEAPVGVIEKVFGVTINNYQVGDEVDFANDRDPQIPASLSGIVTAVFGLQNIDRMHGTMQGARNAKGPDYVPGPGYAVGPPAHGDGDPTRKPGSQPSPMALNSSGPQPGTPSMTNGQIDPSDLYSSQGYNYGALSNLDHCCNVPGDSGGSPPESSIGIVAWAGPDLSSGGDIATFASQYGLAYYITPLWIDGKTPTPSECDTLNSGCPGDGDDDEITVDTEFSTAYANSFGSYLDTAHVYIYEAANTYYSTFTDLYNYMLSDNHAKQLTTSWDWTDVDFGSSSEMNTLHGIFNSMVGQGWTLINASGDQGSTSDCADAIRVFWPAEDPDFLAAGGTELTLNPTTGAFESEVAWTGGTSSNSCSSNGGGGGGGVSTFFSQPSWQSGLTYVYYNPTDNEYWKVTGNTMRLLPDMALNAGGTWENYYYKGGWGGVLGTSIVAPQLAAFFARENSYLDYIGNICGSGSSACAPVGIPGQFMYWNGGGSAAHQPFYDTLTGCNSNNITAEYSLISYCATTGWDAATGWGSANMLQLAWGINYNLIPAYGEPVITFSGPTTSKWFNSDQEVSWTVKTINTRSGNSNPPPGVAGFTQGWDSVPADPYSEPHGGSGNSFYSGPQYPFGKSGCLSFNGLNGCSSYSVGQGCHTAYVEAWDNQGDPVTDSYGPVCYDTVDPTVTNSTSPNASGWVNQSVAVTLTATDPGGSNASGIYKTYYALNNETTCKPGSVSGCSVYTGPVTVSAQGQTGFYYFTEDNAGNWSTWWVLTISIDLSTPVTTASLSGTVYSGSTYKSAVGVTLSATDSGGSGIAHTYYELDGGSQTTYSGTFTVSALGSHTVKYWSVNGAGTTESAHTLTFTIDSPTTASLVATPNPSMVGQSVKMTATVTATLSGTPTGSVTFWNGATNLGTGTLSGGVATLSTTSLPAGALTLQVSYAGSGNFLATNSAPFDQTVEAQAALTSPAASTVLAGPSVTFSWSAGYGATDYGFRLGTTVGGNNLWGTGPITGTSTTAINLPTNGETIYARLTTFFGSVQVYTDYTFTAASAAALTSPTPSTVLAGPSVTFTWSTAPGATDYGFRLGTTVGSNNLYGSGPITATSVTPPNLPTNGETIYARLTTFYGSIQVYTDYTFTAATQSALTSPTPSTVLVGPSVTFTWSAAPGSTDYGFRLGTTVGGNNLYGSGPITATSATLNNLPTNGETIYARLTTFYGSTQVYTDYTFTAATQAALTSPTPSSTLSGSSVTFTWSAAPGSTDYGLRLGTTVGGNNLYGSGPITATSATPTNLPTNGETIYARLTTFYGSIQVYTDYTFTAAP